MSNRYEVRSSISREKARELIELLANDDRFRDRFEKNPRSVLFEYRIDVAPDSLPETVKLPPKEQIRNLLPPAYDLVGETASPFGFLLLFIVLGAMPVTTGPRRPRDGTG